MAAPETETARLLAPGDDAKTSWRAKSGSWRTIGAGLTVRTADDAWNAVSRTKRSRVACNQRKSRHPAH